MEVRLKRRESPAARGDQRKVQDEKDSGQRLKKRKVKEEAYRGGLEPDLRSSKERALN